MEIINILIFLVALSILIFVHELGHYFFAKLFNVYCYEFSLGMGPAIVKKKFKKDKETVYSLRAFPIGGYVSMAGETNNSQKDNTVPFDRTINGVKAWKRAIIVVAGATVNFIFALILIFAFTFFGGIQDTVKESIVGIADNSVAYEAGLRSNDLITGITFNDDYSSICESTCIINSSEQLFDYLVESRPSKEGDTQEIVFTYLRDNQVNSASITRYFNTQTNASTTIGIGKILESYYPGFFEGIKLSFERFFFVIKLMFSSIATIFTKEGINQLGGPVQIYQVSASQAQEGLLSYLWFLAILSINLGFFNLLPIPGLDGSRFFVSIFEMITRRKLNPKVEAYINAVGLIFLLSLMVLVTVKDVISLF